MMVGDYVSIDGVWHEVLPYGWRIDVPWEEVMGDVPKKKEGNELTEEEIKNALFKQLLKQTLKENNNEEEKSNL